MVFAHTMDLWFLLFACCVCLSDWGDTIFLCGALFTHELKALTACRLTWRNSISDKDLRAWDAITAEGSSFRCRSNDRFRFVSRGRSGRRSRQARALAV